MDKRDLYFIWENPSAEPVALTNEGNIVFEKKIKNLENYYIYCQAVRRIWTISPNDSKESDRITLINERASTWDGEADA